MTNMSHDDDETLINRIRIGDIEFVKEYIKNGGNINRKINENSLLFLACMNKQYDLLSYLFSIGADICRETTFSHAIMGLYAVISNSFNMLKLLIDNNLNLCAKNDTGLSVLAYVCNIANSEVLDLLLEYRDRLDLDITDETGLTPLYICVISKFTYGIKHLLEAGANPFISRRSTGNTPLMFACETRQYEIVKIFLESRRIDICCLLNQTNNKGQTPYKIALEDPDEKITKILSNDGAIMFDSNGFSMEYHDHYAYRVRQLMADITMP